MYRLDTDFFSNSFFRKKHELWVYIDKKIFKYGGDVLDYIESTYFLQNELEFTRPISEAIKNDYS